MADNERTQTGTAEREDTAFDLIGGTGRLEAFSDGVFAIAVTLLVLNLHVPEPSGLHGQSLYSALRLQGWAYVAYIISFAFILIMWINHHRMLKYIGRADHGLLLFNGVLLFFVTLVPFPTSLLATYLGDGTAKHSDQVVAAVVYSGTYFLTAIAFNLVWLWAARDRRLLDGRIHPRHAEEVTRRYRFGPLLYLLCVALAFVNVYASVGLNVVLAIFFAWPGAAELVRRNRSKPSEAV